MAPGSVLTNRHRIDQINNGAAAAALVYELGKQFVAGKLTEQQFVNAVVAADLLTHDAAVRIAKRYMKLFRAAVAPGEVMADLVGAEFDAGASAGRAVYTVRELDRVKTQPGRTQAEYDRAFEQIVANLAVLSDRFAKDAGRDTVIESAEANDRRWRRVTDGNPCAFCAMLASRGPVYRSEDAAGVVVGRNNYGTAAYKAGNVTYGGKISRGKRKGQDRTRGKRGLGEKFHDYCGCTVEESLSEWVPTAKEAEYADLYERAAKACDAEGLPRTGTNVTKKMREMGHGVIHDAVKPPKTQASGAGGGAGNEPPPGLASPGEDDPKSLFVAGGYEPEFVTQHRGALQGAATPEERDALDAYMGSGHSAINTVLRGNGSGKPEPVTLKYTQDLLNLFEKAPLTEESVTVYRGLGLRDLDLEGEEFKAKGFMSTSTNLDVAKEFADDAAWHGHAVVYAIRLPKGMPYLPGTDYEAELILHPKTKFRVVASEIDLGDGVIGTVLEVVT